MTDFPITGGTIPAPVKVVLYGVEGIGKSSLAARFPGAVFIDTEGGTKRLNVRRLPAPSSWQMLTEEVAAAAAGQVDCQTLVLDTADWAEKLCMAAVCQRFQVRGIEDLGYGKGYIYVKEDFARLLDSLEQVVASGRHVVVIAHAALSKFEQPDAVGSYDRWTMKTSKQVAPLLREWCDMLLFANYKTVVEKSGSGPSAKNKATGARRVLYTTHNACWDGKNRFGLPDEVPFDYESIRAIVEGGGVAAPAPAEQKPQAAPVQPALADSLAEQQQAARASIADQLAALGYPPQLAQLLPPAGIDDEMLRHGVFQRGCCPEDMPVRNYPPDLVNNIVEKWPQWSAFILANADIPF